MKRGNIGDREARGEERQYRFGQWCDFVFGCDRGKSAMAQREGILQVLDNFGLGLQLSGEGAHTLELAVCRSKPILLFGHGLGGGNHLLLNGAENAVEDGRYGGRLLWLLGCRGGLRAQGWGRRGCAQERQSYDEILVHCVFLSRGVGREILRLYYAPRHPQVSEQRIRSQIGRHFVNEARI